MNDELRSLLLMVLAFFGGLALGAYASPPLPATPQDTSVYLEFTTGWCSGTVVGPHTILTGTHCTAEGSLVSINDKPARSTDAVSDGRDHTLLTVTQTFDKYARIHQRWLAQSEPVHYIGSPALFRDLYRKGYVQGFCTVGVDCMDSLATKVPPGVDVMGARATLLSTPGWQGDSGAGVFDANGYLVTTISAITEVAPTVVPMVTFDMQFTQEQLEAIQ